MTRFAPSLAIILLLSTYLPSATATTNKCSTSFCGCLENACTTCAGCYMTGNSNECDSGGIKTACAAWCASASNPNNCNNQSGKSECCTGG